MDSGGIALDSVTEGLNDRFAGDGHGLHGGPLREGFDICLHMDLHGTGLTVHGIPDFGVKGNNIRAVLRIAAIRIGGSLRLGVGRRVVPAIRLGGIPRFGIGAVGGRVVSTVRGDVPAAVPTAAIGVRGIVGSGMAAVGGMKRHARHGLRRVLLQGDGGQDQGVGGGKCYDDRQNERNTAPEAVLKDNLQYVLHHCAHPPFLEKVLLIKCLAPSGHPVTAHQRAGLPARSTSKNSQVPLSVVIGIQAGTIPAIRFAEPFSHQLALVCFDASLGTIPLYHSNRNNKRDFCRSTQIIPRFFHSFCHVSFFDSMRRRAAGCFAG